MLSRDVFLVAPTLVPHRETVQSLLTIPPVWKMTVQHCSKAGVVAWFENVKHLVDNKVFKALAGFSGQLAIEPYRALGRTAASPFGLHPLDKESFHFHP